MAAIDLTSETLPEFERRVSALGADAERRWGTMTAARMLAHLRLTFEISLEERESENESYRILTPILYVLLFRVFTKWPKGKIKASMQFLDESADDFESERTQLLDLLKRFVAEAESNPDRITLEPMLGYVSLQKWQRIHGLHTDYHLNQFGG